MSTCSSVTTDYRDRGRTRDRRNSGTSDYGLPPSGYGMRQRQGSVSSLLSQKSGAEFVQGLEDYRIQNRHDLARDQLETQVIFFC